jgi:hypothetical protein
LVHVEFYFEDRHVLFDFCKGARTAIEIFRDVFEDEVEVDFTLLQNVSFSRNRDGGEYSLARTEEIVFEVDDIGMANQLHDL